jgi:threonine aldolase
MAYDLRSDTVTQPTEGMRRAMAEAEVGDDCYGDDPTVLRLQDVVAERLGHPAAVFVPTGTMANQLAVRLHCGPGDAMATHPGAHVRIHENASAAALSGVQIMPIGDRTGYSLRELTALCAEESCGWPPVRLAWLETTIGDAGGQPWPREGDAGMQTIAAWCRTEGRAVHLDGARLWNAHVATGDSLPQLGACADTVSVCLSKGLGAPMGSVLCGPVELIARARELRHAFGGSMRQAGIVAAAGLYALQHHLPRLGDDHRRARRLAEGIADLDVWDVPLPATNLVIGRIRHDLPHAEALCAPLREAGVICYPNVAREVRLAVHQGLDDAAIDDVIQRIRRVLEP